MVRRRARESTDATRQDASIHNNKEFDLVTIENYVRGRKNMKVKLQDIINAIIQLGIDQDWYAFKEDAYRKIAAEWCEDYGIEYE